MVAVLGTGKAHSGDGARLLHDEGKRESEVKRVSKREGRCGVAAL